MDNLLERSECPKKTKHEKNRQIATNESNTIRSEPCQENIFFLLNQWQKKLN